MQVLNFALMVVGSFYSAFFFCGLFASVYIMNNQQLFDWKVVDGIMGPICDYIISPDLEIFVH